MVEFILNIPISTISFFLLLLEKEDWHFSEEFQDTPSNQIGQLPTLCKVVTGCLAPCP